MFQNYKCVTPKFSFSFILVITHNFSCLAETIAIPLAYNIQSGQLDLLGSEVTSRLFLGALILPI